MCIVMMTQQVAEMDDQREVDRRTNNDRRKGMSHGLRTIATNMRRMANHATGTRLSLEDQSVLIFDADTLERIANVLDGIDERKGERRA